ncbi:MAG TPA: aminotransferase class V-fold PLP-dependent enzyme [Mycobacteriales bacterium]|nr:aminotransferase class V-fold PLP-dependent enzyme [Mycobacteriales bacterium]
MRVGGQLDVAERAERLDDRRTADPDAADAAESGRLSDAIARLVPELTRFTAYTTADRAVADRAQWRGVLDRPLPDDGAGLETVLDELAVAVEHGCRIGQPGFVGWIENAPTTSGVLASLAATTAGAQRYLLHAFNGLEWIALRWLAELCGLPSTAQGVFCSGGSTANLVALGAARQWTFEQRGIDVGRDGLPRTGTVRVYGSTEVHRTVHRACAVLGMGRESFRPVPIDRRQRIDVAALDAALTEDRRAGVVPVAVVAAAGTTNTGAVDPIADVLEVARRHRAWVHVDGAYGLVAAAHPALRALFEGVAEADSVVVDPHKWLATGVGVGAAYVRHPGVLMRAFVEGEADYLEGSFSSTADSLASQFDAMGGPWADLGVELSAPSRGALVWAVLREIGVAGVRRRVARHCAYARHLAGLVADHPRLELLAEPQLSVCCFRYRPATVGEDLDLLNARILERLRRETPHVPSSTVVDGRFAIRPCYVNPRTSPADVDALADAVVRLGDEETA